MADKMGIPRDEILAMEPGRELDELTIREVLGLEPRFDDETETVMILKESPFGEIYQDFSPSTDISAAWEVEEKVGEMPERVKANYLTELILLSGGRGFTMVHATPEQRCKAALLAVIDHD